MMTRLKQWSEHQQINGHIGIIMDNQGAIDISLVENGVTAVGWNFTYFHDRRNFMVGQ